MINNWKKFNEGAWDGDGFTRVREYDDRFTPNNLVDFDPKCVKEIEKLLPSIPYKWWLDIKFAKDNDARLSKNFSIRFSLPHKATDYSKTYITIESYKDEWFFLKQMVILGGSDRYSLGRSYEYFYECDQVEGVINCLKTLAKI